MSASGSTAGRPQGAAGTGNDRRRAQAMGHIAFNTALAVGFGLLYWRAESLPSSMWEPLGSGSFPKLTLGGLICFNLAIIVQQTRRLIATSALPNGAIRAWLWSHRLAFVVLALFAAYVLAMPWVGFMWASLAFLAATQMALGARSRRALIAVAVISLIFSFGIALLFGDVFNIMLPPPFWQ